MELRRNMHCTEFADDVIMLITISNILIRISDPCKPEEVTHDKKHRNTGPYPSHYRRHRDFGIGPLAEILVGLNRPSAPGHRRGAMVSAVFLAGNQYL